MHVVKFVRDVVVDLIPAGEEIKYFTYPPPQVASDGMLLETQQEVNQLIAPVLHICHVGEADTYVAWSEQVEELFGIPIRTIIREHEDELARLHDELDQTHLQLTWWRSLPFLRRLKFLFSPGSIQL